ncbi:MAG: VWA domain-containing protein, partial [Pseudomonadota bacterium]
MFRFANPSVFSLFFILLVVVAYFFFNHYRVQKKLKSVFGQKMLGFFTRQFSQVKKKLKFSLSILALSCMIFALARPQMGKGKRQITSQGVELMVAVDVSNSMLSEDV